MGAHHIAVPPITEPVPVLDTFVTGVDWQLCGEFVRIIYWVEHPLEYGTDPALVATERQVVAKVVMPMRTWLALPFRRPQPANVG